MQLAPRRLLVGLLILFVLSAGCGDGGSEQNKSVGDLNAYCKLARRLDREQTKSFAKVLQNPKATARDNQDAQRRFLEAHETEVNHLKAAAPQEISDDAKTTIAAFRGRAGLGPTVDESTAEAAGKRIQKFIRRNCK